MIVAGVFLAAGSSRRFGPDDKLLAQWQSRALISYAAEAMRAVPLDRRIAVISNDALRPHLQDFDIVQIEAAQQSDSLRAGLSAIQTFDRVLIALGDMPFVDGALLSNVIATCTDELPAAACDQDYLGPPVCFPQTWKDRLANLRGDQGAGRLISNLPHFMRVSAASKIDDVDTAEDLSRLDQQRAEIRGTHQ